MNCTAHVHDKGCDVWVPTQAQSNSHKIAAEASGVDPEQVRIHTTFLGGGFGRRAETDFVYQAVTLAALVKKPVQLIWTREETTQHGFYRPAVISRFQVALNAQGDPYRWANQLALPNVLYQKVPVVPSVVWKLTGDIIGVDGAKNPPYAHGDVDVETLHVELDTPLGFWRAVGHSHNGFFVESVVDELANLAEEDSAAYRRRLYGEHPRHLAVLNAVTAMAKWDTKRPEGRHLGLAVHESFGSVVGEVVELSVDQDNVVTLHRIWCAIHCGLVINPNAVRAQMESGIVYGLSAATRGKITLEKGVVQQSNFHDYPIMRMNEIPPIEVQLLDSTDDPTGVGETALPPIAAAVGNAIHAATGQRLRRLPFSESGFKTWRATRG
jgi:CO/xanthine dehydrogenase Mo-binding subunit